ncbi:hypothetical protein ILUMI_27113 [Ignelater luminosus]|uniref:RRM domain-containing protein n=1 Tax=Ignelater luminosus TaxID=2038154 RepID=A0A8K0FVR7_IGNLU|nr:hypothetical protein ILUMI_27113 [Ignelater luminosus]
MEQNRKKTERSTCAISYLETNVSNVTWRLQYLSRCTGYPIHNLKYLRKVGPRIGDENPPERGSEVFAHRLPADALEDELYWFFSLGGKIYDMRLMLRPSGFANRGFAFVRYCNPEQARQAMELLNQVDFRPCVRIVLEKSLENNRLFVSGVPLMKTKKDIWEELLNIGMEGIVDVIVYKSHRSYYNNRGFIFIEFESHEKASDTRREFVDNLELWNKQVILDWAEPLKRVDPEVMAKVN